RYPRLVVTYETQVAAGSHANVTALRFESVDIPQGATVTSASLRFTPQASDSGAAEWTISAEASDDSPPLAATAGNISGRTKTTAATSPWTLPGATADEAFSTPDSIDLLSVVQEIVNRPGWCGGNAITFIIEGTGTRRIKSAEQ